MNSKSDPKVNAEQTNDIRRIAVERCDSLIKWYEIHQKRQRSRMAFSRLIAIVLSGLVPVLVIVQMSLKSNTTWWLVMSILIAMFPASAAIISAMNEIFQYKENWIRFSEAAEELKSERVKFMTRTTQDYERNLDDYKALSNFVTKVEAIVIKETKKWRVQAGRSKELDGLLKSLGQEAKG